jgi:hypothetical protein
MSPSSCQVSLQQNKSFLYRLQAHHFCDESNCRLYRKPKTFQTYTFDAARRLACEAGYRTMLFKRRCTGTAHRRPVNNGSIIILLLYCTRECSCFLNKWDTNCPRAKFLDEIQTKVLKVFLLAIHSHLYSFAVRFLFHQTHATSNSFYSSVTVQCKGERRENLIGNHTLSLWLKKSIQKPQVCQWRRFPFAPCLCMYIQLMGD